jgi:hypothetical protein
MSIKVYVAGPYSQGDVAANVSVAVSAGEVLHNAGIVPYIPHLSHFWHFKFPKPYIQWLDYDNEWLTLGRSLGLPIFTRVDEVIAWAQVNYADEVKRATDRLAEAARLSIPLPK